MEHFRRSEAQTNIGIAQGGAQDIVLPLRREHPHWWLQGRTDSMICLFSII